MELAVVVVEFFIVCKLVSWTKLFPGGSSCRKHGVLWQGHVVFLSTGTITSAMMSVWLG